MKPQTNLRNSFFNVSHLTHPSNVAVSIYIYICVCVNIYIYDTGKYIDLEADHLF